MCQHCTIIHVKTHLEMSKTYYYFILRAACVLARKEVRELFGDLGNRENGFRLTFRYSPI